MPMQTAKQKDVLKQAEAAEKNARAQLKDIQQKMKDSKSHHQRELKEAETAITRAKKEAESVVKEAKAKEQEMQALRLEVEELEKSVQTQQQQVYCVPHLFLNKLPLPRSVSPNRSLEPTLPNSDFAFDILMCLCTSSPHRLMPVLLL